MANFQKILAVPPDVLFVFDESVFELPLEVAGRSRRAKWKRSSSLRTVTSKGIVIVSSRFIPEDVDVGVVRAAAGQPVDQPRVSMKGESNRLVLREEFSKSTSPNQWLLVLGPRFHARPVDS